MRLRPTTIVALLGILLGCTDHSLSPSNTITTAVGGTIQTIDPLYATDAVGQHIGELVFAPLVVISDSLQPEAYLAKSFKVVSDREIRFTLRPNCRLHDGTPITSKIVTDSVNAYLDPHTLSPHTESLKNIAGVKSVSDYEFSLLLRKPDPSILAYLPILKIFKKSGDHLIGSGQFEVASASSTEVDLNRVGNGCQPLPRFTKLKVKVVRDDLSRFLKLQKGELDIVLNEMDFRKVSLVSTGESNELRAISSPGVGYNYIGVNFGSAKLRDPKVREALALSFDIPKIIRFKNLSYAKQAATILPSLSPFANGHLSFHKRDLERARFLLDAAGYYNGRNRKPPLVISLKTTNNSAVLERAAVLADEAREAGIQLELHSYEWGIFYQDVKSGNTDLYMLRWVGVTDPGIYYEVFHSAGKNNRTNYRNSEVDKLLDLAQSTLNFSKRKAALDRVQEIVSRELPYISLWHNDNAAIFRKDISGVKLYATGSWRTFLELSKGDN